MQIFTLFFYLTVLLLPTQLGLHFWPDWTLILGRRVDYLAPAIYLTDITIILTVCTWFLQKKNRTRCINGIRRYKLYCFLTLILIAINCAYSSNPLVSLYMWGKGIEYILFFYVIYVSKPSLKTTIYCFMGAVFYSSLIAIIQSSLQHTIGGIFWFLGERTFNIDTPGIAKINWCWPPGNTCIELLRPYATFPHPNVLGGFLGTTIPLLLYRLQTEKNRYIRLALMGSMALGIFTLGLTSSRSAWIIGGCMIFGTFMLSIKQSLITKIVGVLGIAAALVCAWPYFSALNTENESVFIRLDLAKAALVLMCQHPIVGTGLGTFLFHLPQVVQMRDLFFLQPVHNIYLLFFSETGITGLLLLSFIMYFYKKLRKHTQSVIVLLPLVGLCILGLMDHYPISVQQGQLLTTCFLALPFFKTDS